MGSRDQREACFGRKTAALEKEKVVLARAVRLREKGRCVGQEADKQARLAADEKYKQHLARNLVVHERRLRTRRSSLHTVMSF